MKVGMIGAGSIAGIMADTIKEMDRVQNYTVAARDYERTAKFAQGYGSEKTYESYEELVEDVGVELTYIAMPCSHHYEHIKSCLNHGKHVLCEKSFTVNELQAREMLELVREKKPLLTEAIRTRYIPTRKTLDDMLLSGVIGKPYMLTANPGYIINGREHIIRPELAGGVLLDVGIYPLNFVSMVFGDEMDTITGIAVMAETSVDAQNNITIIYKDGRVTALYGSAMGPSDRRDIIYGDNGFIEVENINNCEGIRIYDHSRNMIASHDTPKQISEYEYEVGACLRAVGEGVLECPEIPREETLRMMGWMDELRR